MGSQPQPCVAGRLSVPYRRLMKAVNASFVHHDRSPARGLEKKQKPRRGRCCKKTDQAAEGTWTGHGNRVFSLRRRPLLLIHSPRWRWRPLVMHRQVTAHPSPAAHWASAAAALCTANCRGGIGLVAIAAATSSTPGKPPLATYCGIRARPLRHAPTRRRGSPSPRRAACFAYVLFRTLLVQGEKKENYRRV